MLQGAAGLILSARTIRRLRWRCGKAARHLSAIGQVGQDSLGIFRSLDVIGIREGKGSLPRLQEHARSRVCDALETWTSGEKGYPTVQIQEITSPNNTLPCREACHAG